MVSFGDERLTAIGRYRLEPIIVVQKDIHEGLLCIGLLRVPFMIEQETCIEENEGYQFKLGVP
jgi:hypothetical protein